MELIKIPNIKIEWQKHWKIRALSINGKSPALEGIEHWNKKEISKMYDALPSDVVALFEKTKPVKDIKIKKEDFDRDPKFVADYIKSKFINDVLLLMEKNVINENKLANKLKWSRQYVNKVLKEKTNFTLSSIAMIVCALNVDFDFELRQKQVVVKQPKIVFSPKKTKVFVTPFKKNSYKESSDYKNHLISYEEGRMAAR